MAGTKERRKSCNRLPIRDTQDAKPDHTVVRLHGWKMGQKRATRCLRDSVNGLSPGWDSREYGESRDRRRATYLRGIYQLKREKNGTKDGEREAEVVGGIDSHPLGD